MGQKDTGSRTGGSRAVGQEQKDTASRTGGSRAGGGRTGAEGHWQ